MAASFGSSAAEAAEQLERAAASSDSSAILLATQRFQTHIRGAAADNDAFTSRLWEAVISTISSNELPDTSVESLRDLSIELAACKPPSIVAVGGICSARLSKAGSDTESLTGALKVIAVLGSIPALRLQLARSELPLLLLRLHQRHSIASSSSLASDLSVSFKNPAQRSHPVPPLPSHGLRIPYSSSAASSALMSPPSSTQRSAAATIARTGSALGSEGIFGSFIDGGGSSRRSQRDGGSLSSSRDFSASAGAKPSHPPRRMSRYRGPLHAAVFSFCVTASGVASSRRSKDMPPLAFGVPVPQAHDFHGTFSQVPSWHSSQLRVHLTQPQAGW
jgi:hypothetical protein